MFNLNDKTYKIGINNKLEVGDLDQENISFTNSCPFYFRNSQPNFICRSKRVRTK